MSADDKSVAPASSAPLAQSASPFDLRALTPARVALDRTGDSIATRHALEFSLAHAQARDAVHSALSVASLMAALRERKLAASSVHSAARDRTEYLRRPDLGRTLSPVSAAQLADSGAPSSARSHRDRVGYSREARTASSTLLQRATDNQQPATVLSIILADGLSALAVERHAQPLLDALLPLLKIDESSESWQLGPIIIAEQARVALGDEIGEALHAAATVILIGERPGLSSPDSLGAYITWAPHRGRTDAERNCVSNIRGEGLDYATAAAKIAWYLNQGRRLGATGVALRGLNTARASPALDTASKPE